MKSHTLRTISVLLTMCMLLSLTSPGPVVFGQSILSDNTETTEETSTSTDSSESEATEPSEGETTEPSEGETTDSSESESTEPSEGETTEPSEGESTDPSESESTEPSEGESTEPSEGETTNPSEGETTDPSEGESTEPSEGESTEPSEGESTEPSEGESTEPSEGESTEPSEGESTDPSEGEPTEPSEGEPTEPSEGESTEPSEGESTDPSEGEPTDPSEGESTDPSEDNGDKEAPVFGDLARNPEQWAKEAEYTFSITDASSLTVTVVTPSGLTLSLSPDESGVYRFIAETNGTYQLIATDEAGNTTSYEITETQIDAESPIISSHTRNEDGWTQQATYTFSVSDANAVTVFVSIAPGVDQELIPDEDGSYHVIIAENGSYVVTVTDVTGNVSEIAITESQIDKDVPVISTPIRDKEGWAQESAYSFTVAEATNITVFVTDPTGTATEITADTNGLYWVNVSANGTYVILVTDEAGNAASVIIEETEIDTHAPVISSPLRDQESWAQQATYQLTVSEPALSAVFLLFGQEGPVALTPDENGSYSFTVSKNGSYVIQAVDIAGNIATIDVVESFIDTDEPEIQTPVRNQTGWVFQADYTFTVQDASVNQVTLTAPDNSIRELIADENGQYLFTVGTNGTYTITVTDDADNMASVSVTEDHIDQAAPVISTPTRTEEGWATQAEYSFTVSDIDAVTVTLLRPDGETQELSNKTGTFSFLAEDNGTYEITVIDRAGNSASIEVLESEIDRNAPVVDTPVRDYIGWRQETTYHVVITDISSGVISVTVVYPNGDVKELGTDEQGYFWSVTENGIYKIIATDAVGNAATLELTESNIDRDIPTVGNLTRKKTGWAQSVQYTFTASDSAASISGVTIAHPDGTVTEIQGNKGQYSFTISANGSYVITITDGAGNTATLNFDETQIDLTLPEITEPIRSQISWSKQVSYTFQVSDNSTEIASVTLTTPHGDTLNLAPGKTGSYSFLVNENGSYIITVKDSAGNTATWNITEDHIDLDAPIIETPIRQEDGWEQKTEYVFTAADNASGIASVYVQAQGGTREELTADNNGYYRFTVQANLVYTITVNDNVGNQSTIIVTENQIDLNPPVFQTPSREHPDWQPHTTYSFQVDDLESSIISVVLRANGEEINLTPDENGIYSFPVSENGIYTIIAMDEAKNVTELTVEETHIDYTSPTIEWNRVDIIWTTQREYTFTILDNLSGISKVTVQFNSDEAEILTAGDDEETYSFIAVKNGTYLITVTDKAGNTSTLTMTEDRIDRTAPTIDQPIRDLNGWQQEVEYSFLATDVGAGIREVSVAFGSEILVLTPDASGVYRYSVTQNGTYTIIAVDAVGNKSTITVLEEQIDRTAPVIQTPNREHSGWKPETTYSFLAEDMESSIVSVVLQVGDKKITLTPDENGIYSFPVSENGIYTIIAMDEAKNVSELTVEETHIDYTNPTIEWNRVEIIWATKREYAFTIQDNLSGVSVVTVQFNNGESEILTAGDDGKTYTFIATQNGTYLITVTDLAGNISNLTMTEDRIDRTAPTIDQPIRDLDGWQQEVEYSFLATDLGAGIQEVSIAFGAEILVLTPDAAGIYRFTVSQNGTYTIAAIDAVGNARTLTVLEEQIDRTAPVIEPPIREQEGWQQQAVYQFNAFDSAAGIVTVEVHTQQGELIPVISQGNGCYIFTATMNTVYIITVVDVAGNTTELAIQEKYIDVTAPTITRQESDTDGLWLYEREHIISVFDDMAGVATVTVSFNGEAPVVLMYQSHMNGYSFVAMENGIYTLTATDIAGNVSTLEIVEDHVDYTAPGISDPARQAEGWQQKVVYAFSVSDIQSGIERVIVRSPKGLLVKLNAVGNDYSFTAELNGQYTITITDIVGNITVLYLNETNIDTTIPDIQQHAYPTDGQWLTERLYRFTITDSQSGIASVILSQAGKDNVLLNRQEDGTYQFVAYDNASYTITVTDNVGNVATITVLEELLDQTAPQFGKPSRGEDGWQQDTFYTFTVSDASVGMDMVKVMIGDQSITLEKLDETTYRFPVVMNGTYVIISSDKLGNESQVTVTEDHIDITKPGFSDIQTQQEWDHDRNWAAITITDNASLATVVFTDAAKQDLAFTVEGSRYYLDIIRNGTYTVTATDEAGNVSMTTFVIDHIDDTEPTEPVLKANGTGLWVNVDVNMTAAAKDLQSGIRAYWYSTSTDVFSKDQWHRMELNDNMGYLTLTNDQDLIYYVVAEDAVGRISTVSQIQVKIDKTPAQDLTASVSKQEGSGYLKMVNGVALYLDQALFTAKASDSASGVVRYEYRITGDNGSDTGWISMEAGAEGIQQIFRDVESIYTVHVRVFDLAGNCSAEFSTKPFILELTHGEDKEPAPHIEMNVTTGSYTGIWTKDTISIIVSGSASVSGIDFYEYRVDYADPDIPDIDWAKISDAHENAALSVGKDTNAIYYFRAVSYAGNRSMETSRTVKVQKTLPDAAVFSLPAATGTHGWYTAYPEYQVVLAERNSFLAPVVYTIRYSYNAGTEKVLEYDGTTLPAINQDGNWYFEIITTDAAGNVSTADASYFDINIDTLAPDQVDVLLNDTTILVNGTGTSSRSHVNILNLVSPVDFSIFRATSVSVTANAQGGTSGLLGIYYQIVAEHDQYSTKGTWTPLPETGIELNPDGKYRLYFKAVDIAGNTTYFNGENIILDATAASSTMMPSSENQSSHGFYYADATLNLSVQDPAIGEYAAFAGLGSIRYQITCDGFVTQEGQLWPGSGTIKEQQGRVISWDGSIQIDATLNNSNNIAVKVLVTDVAGNTSTFFMNEGVVKIDTTVPVISGSYDNNMPAATINKSAAFTGSRTLTLTVLEKNFVAGESLVWVTDQDTGKTLSYKWVSDGLVHTATIPVTEDGHYTVGVTIKDAAGNTESKILYEQGTESADAFIIDNTASKIQVSYENNEVLNEMYFDAPRTLTVTVTERNFDPEKISAALQIVPAGEDGSTVILSDWHSEGNVHTATMIIDKDAVYSLTVTGKDALGNDAEETVYTGTAPQHWVLDTVMNTPSIDHVVNDTAYNGTIVPEITVLDPNIDRIILKLIRTRMYEIEVDVTDLLLTEDKVIYQNITGGQKVALDIFPFEEGMDGEYTLIVQVLDKAGNEASNLVNFYTNRYGSVYIYDQALNDILNGYHQKIEQDITITEYNPSGIKDGSAVVHITVDGVPLSASVFTTTPVNNSESGWYEYVHVISKDNFVRDGVYEVVLSTKDTAGNVPENTAEDLAIRFAVDTTIPELPSIIGMEEDIVKADSVKVTLSAMDNVQLESITVYLNGKVLEQWVGIDNYSEEHSFTIPAGLEHTVRLVVVDKAGNVLDTADGSFAPGYAFNDTITVSTNFFLRLYANRVLFYSSIAGIAAVLVGGAVLIVVMAKKKKAKKPTTDTTSETN